ncbi:MAG: hypothetical protein H7308_03395 [Chthonomonadaceae bacterium]|nr:hypothetical protein [Chthonomonadaceae bacterium]
MSEKDDIGTRAEEIYRALLRDLLEKPENLGKLVSIDVESGDYELEIEGEMEAANRLRTRHPSARVFGLRIGYKTAYSVGGTRERLKR